MGQDDKQLVDKIMERLSEKAQEFVLNGMLYTFYVFIALVAFFVLTGTMRSWGWF